MATNRALPKGTKIEKKGPNEFIAYGPDGKPHGRHTSEAEAFRAAEQAAGVEVGPSAKEIETERRAHELRMAEMNPGYVPKDVPKTAAQRAMRIAERRIEQARKHYAATE